MCCDTDGNLSDKASRSITSKSWSNAMASSDSVSKGAFAKYYESATRIS